MTTDPKGRGSPRTMPDMIVDQDKREEAYEAQQRLQMAPCGTILRGGRVCGSTHISALTLRCFRCGEPR